MTRIALSISCLAAVMVALPAAADDANLIIDGGFESPVVGPGGFQSGNNAYNLGDSFGPGNVWTVVGSSAGQVVVYPNTETTGNPPTALNVAEGVQAADLTGRIDNGGATGVAQTFATTNGTTYSLSFFEGQYNNQNASIAVDLNGDLFQTATETAGFDGGTTVWQQFTYSFTATGDTTSLAFLNNSPGGVSEVGLDDVVVSPVPLPAAAWLLLSGVGGLAAFARKRLTG